MGLEVLGEKADRFPNLNDALRMIFKEQWQLFFDDLIVVVQIALRHRALFIKEDTFFLEVDDEKLTFLRNRPHHEIFLDQPQI